ncbi:hypothetical protein [Actinomyces gaoshouyii]|uniref:hypothetical protein n=1 Tax=Actinomyces gaoshouyii TaxID=1960083 RepID=UPI0009C17DCF|nr:hypothetical protein [Actinomyces gaoshouyii]ARD41160.1 hypothetical protein B6G06_01180 [Actinomyces gaoshouyii]
MTAPRIASRAPRLLAAAAALLLGASALGACSVRPGIAATSSYTGLDGTTHSTTITERELQEAAEELKPLNWPVSGTLRLLLSADIIEEVCASQGLAVSDEQVDLLLDDQIGKGRHSVQARRAMRATYLYGIISNPGRGGIGAPRAAQAQADIQRIDGAAEVEVSPRYSSARPWLLAPSAAGPVPPERGAQQPAAR